MNALEEYFGGIVDGKIVACEKMKRVSELVLERYANPGQFHFDQAIADKHTGFIERFCYLPAGRAGIPFTLELFQKARFEVVFGFVDDDDLRQYQEALVIEGRKNGKTSETGAVSFDLTANDGEYAPETYFVATKLDQAKKGFNAALSMLHQSPQLRAHFHKRAADIFFPPNMGTIKALASNTNTLDSLDVSLGCVDELAAIKNRDLYDLIKQGMAARRQPLLWCITTNGFVRENIFDAQYEYASKWLFGQLAEPNDRFIAFIYELDDRSEWDDEAAWIKANPGLGTVKSIEFLRNSVAKAKDDPAYKPTVMVKDFNMIENTATAWLSFGDIEQVEPDPERPGKTRRITFDFREMAFRYGIGGMDAADSIDLNAAVALCQRRYPADHTDEALRGMVDPRIYMRSMYWLPESVLEEAAGSGSRRERDDVPYLLWERRGLLRTYPGNKVDKKVFLDWFHELKYEDDLYMFAIGYDPWHIDDSLLREFHGEFGKQAMVPVRQGTITMSQPLMALKADLRANLVPNNSHPIDMWCLSNTEVRSDINGNIQLVKALDRRKRNDGTAALADAYVVLCDRRDDYVNLI
jgi:phage terminase large subunit-like protein